jgi:hypothetical protein
VLLLSCGEWPTRFERVDYDRPRVLDFVYKNLSDTTLCEGAPGDSMLVIAYFSGYPVDSIEWTVSWNVVLSPYFGDTAQDIEPLEYEEVTAGAQGFGPATQIHAIKFKIPDSIMYESEGIDEALLAERGVDKKTLLGMIELMTQSDTSQIVSDSAFQGFMAQFAGMSLDSAMLALNYFLQALSAPVRLNATLNGVYKNESEFTVRYNRLLSWLPGVFVNHNPVINFVGIHKVKNPQPLRLDPAQMGERDSTYVLFARDSLDPSLVHHPIFATTIILDTGYTYYVAVDSGFLFGADIRDMGITKNGLIEPETYYTQWFYQLDSAEMTGVKTSDLLIIPTTAQPVQQMLAPLDERVTKAVLWVQLYDAASGEILRPYGSTLAEVSITFAYTPAYLEMIRKGEGGFRF